MNHPTVTLASGTHSATIGYDRHTERTTVQHILPNGQLLTEIRAASFQDPSDYRVSYFELGREHEGVLERDASQRFHLHYYDNDADQHETRVLATGSAIEIYRDGVFLAGRVDHKLPGGYYFEPIQEVEVQPFALESSMVARHTTWKYSDDEQPA